MEVLHDTPFEQSLDEIIDRDGSFARVAVLKATFQIDKRGRLEVAEQQEPVRILDECTGARGRSSVLHESDGAYFKPGTDVVVIGSAHAPGGRPAKSFMASLSVGPVKKSILVLGDRIWSHSALLGVRKSSPTPTEVVPLCWERAFGGTDASQDPAGEPEMEWRNPIGAGFCVRRSADALDGLRLPNFEEPGHRIRSWRSKPAPAGFGFVGRSGQPRVQYAGTYDDEWTRSRMPLLPLDFDYRFFNGAPEDQIVRPHLNGGELVWARNLSERGDEHFELPAIDVCFRGVARGRRIELPGALDTVILMLDRRRVVLTWRAKFAVSMNERSEAIRARVARRS